DLDQRPLLDLLDGVRGDVTFRSIPTVADQEHYCYQVAATVGLSMVRILGATGRESLRHAAELGIAMQLTNIVRDVGEDVQRGRIYLPEEELLAFGCSAAQLADGRVDAGFVALLQRQIGRARSYYRRGEAGIAVLPPDAQLAVRLAARMYAGILDKVEQRRYDVFTSRAHVSLREKLQLTLRILVEQRR
ncbi:MAG TPA: phytoene/squalene synthase family protein, partial [Chloroflexota bacterium]|nr:phytoene/squalene synthase family protein [Chloroflexota bacterium]